MTEKTETALSLLHRYGLPEDVIDGVLCLHAQELAATIRTTDLPDWFTDVDLFENGVGWAADLITPGQQSTAAAAAVRPPATDRTACRTTQHCAYHGWCHRCDPEFAAVMSRVNVAIQRSDIGESHWGPLYEVVGKALRCASLPAPADRAAVCICGHTEQQHFEDVCITEITGCDCGDFIPPDAAREVIARWREAAMRKPADRAAVLREGEAAMRAEAKRLTGEFNDSDILHEDGPASAVATWKQAAALLGRLAAVPAAVSGRTDDETRGCDCPNEDAAEHMFGSDSCTCIPFIRQDGETRYCSPTDTVDMISGWEIGRDCPHHQPAVGGAQPKETPPPTAYSDGKGRVFCVACPRSDDADVPLAIEDVDPWDLCPSCGRHVVDVARAIEQQPKEAGA